MASDHDEPEDVHRLDTVPPPPGDEDAYSAETVVREAPESVLAETRTAAKAAAAAARTAAYAASRTDATATEDAGTAWDERGAAEGGRATAVLLLVVLAAATATLYALSALR